MSQNSTTLASVHKGWDEYQRMLVAIIAPLSTEQLALRVAPAQNPAWLLAAHISGARVRWLQGRLGEGDPSLAAFSSWDDDDAPPRGAAALVEGLQASWRIIEDCLNRWTPAMLTEPVATRPGSEQSRRWVIWHILEHDIHHGGELCLTLGSGGVAIPDM